MKFTNPIDDERIYHFNKSLGQIDTGYSEKTDAVIRNQPRMAVSPVTSRIYGTFVDEDGILKAGLALADDSDWESTWAVPIIPSNQTGKIRNPFISIDDQGNVCIGYEYWPTSIAPEVWVYDERMVGAVVVSYVQKVTEGRCPVTISDIDNDLLIFYKKSDGTLCWRARSAPPYAAVWDTESVVSVTGLTGDLYIDDVFIINRTNDWEVSAIILCISKREIGRHTLYYVRSSNWPRTIQPEEVSEIDVAISVISWIVIVTYETDEIATLELYLNMINWIWVQEYSTVDQLFAMAEVASITWTGGLVYEVDENNVTCDERLTVIAWTSNNNVDSPDERVDSTLQITAIVWTSV